MSWCNREHSTVLTAGTNGRRPSAQAGHRPAPVATTLGSRVLALRAGTASAVAEDGGRVVVGAVGAAEAGAAPRPPARLPSADAGMRLYADMLLILFRGGRTCASQ